MPLETPNVGDLLVLVAVVTAASLYGLHKELTNVVMRPTRKQDFVMTQVF
jgi:hypothetical protein